MSSPRHPTTRFSDRVDDYVKFRPTYPPEIVDTILHHCPVDESWAVADIGAGTGISTSLLLRMGCRIFAVEPNDQMRRIAERDLSPKSLFRSVSGRAEATSLADRSIDLIAAFQAFHWFDREPTRREFKRIARNGCWILIVWNDRITDEPGFLADYETLLKGLPEYNMVNHKNVLAADVAAFIGDSHLHTARFPNSQWLDWDGLRGRFASSSYVPKPGSGEYESLLLRLTELFEKNRVNDRIEIRYNTDVYLGKLS